MGTPFEKFSGRGKSSFGLNCDAPAMLDVLLFVAIATSDESSDWLLPQKICQSNTPYLNKERLQEMINGSPLLHKAKAMIDVERSSLAVSFVNALIKEASLVFFEDSCESFDKYEDFLVSVGNKVPYVKNVNGTARFVNDYPPTGATCFLHIKNRYVVAVWDYGTHIKLRSYIYLAYLGSDDIQCYGRPTVLIEGSANVLSTVAVPKRVQVARDTPMSRAWKTAQENLMRKLDVTKLTSLHKEINREIIQLLSYKPEGPSNVFDLLIDLRSRIRNRSKAITEMGELSMFGSTIKKDTLAKLTQAFSDVIGARKNAKQVERAFAHITKGLSKNQLIGAMFLYILKRCSEEVKKNASEQLPITYSIGQVDDYAKDSEELVVDVFERDYKSDQFVYENEAGEKVMFELAIATALFTIKGRPFIDSLVPYVYDEKLPSRAALGKGLGKFLPSTLSRWSWRDAIFAYAISGDNDPLYQISLDGIASGLVYFGKSFDEEATTRKQLDKYVTYPVYASSRRTYRAVAHILADEVEVADKKFLVVPTVSDIFSAQMYDNGKVNKSYVSVNSEWDDVTEKVTSKVDIFCKIFEVDNKNSRIGAMLFEDVPVYLSPTGRPSGIEYYETFDKEALIKIIQSKIVNAKI